MIATHRLADLIPAMSDDEYARHRDDIAANGLMEPIVRYEGQVLDGRHRLRACEETGVEPRFVEYDGDAPAQFVLSHNLSRRHLSVSQRAMIATDFLPELEAEAHSHSGARNDLHKTSVSEDTQVAEGPGGQPARAAIAAGDVVGVSGITVARAKRVVKHDPDLAQQVREGALTVNAAHERVRDATPQPSRRASSPSSLDTGRGQQQAEANRRKVEKLDGQLSGMARGVTQGINIQYAVAAMSTEEAAEHHRSISESLGSLRQFNAALQEAANARREDPPHN